MLTFEGKFSFLGEEIDFEKAKYVVLPTPLEITQTGKRSCRDAWISIIQASQLLENYDFELNYETKDIIYTAGPMVLSANPEKAIEEISKEVKEILEEGKFPILIGGEHTIATGASEAGSFDFVIFDAHADFRDTMLNQRYSHATVVRRISEKHKAIVMGVRSISLEENYDIQGAYNTKFYDIYNLDAADFDKVGSDVWISVDMDVFDPSIAPSVAVPSLRGLDYMTFLKLIRKIFANKNVVGIDISEVIPSETIITELLAAKVIQDVVALKEISAEKS
jgi:agmatinase